VGKPLLQRLTETYETRYAKVVDWCLSNGIWVIPSMIFHNEDTVPTKQEWPDGKGYAGFWDDEASQAEFAEAWRAFAERFKGRKEMLFDLMNEPHGALNTEGNEKSTEGWNRVYPRALSAIRKADPNRWVVVEPFWGGTSRFGRLTVVNDPYVIYSFHFYVPKAFIRGTNKENHYPGFYAGEPWEKAQQWDKAALAERMQPAVEFQKRTGARILVGEFSVGLRVPFKEDRVRWVKDVLELMAERRFDDWLYWSYSAHTHNPRYGGSGFEVDDDLRPLLLSEFRKNNY
jgi:aryl-phospho-beta-D-glucosidase BglC (GH1 family)